MVAFDIDGTLGSYHSHLSEFMALYWGWDPIRQPPGSWNGEGEFEDWFGLTKEQYRQAKLAYRQGGWKRWMPPFVGATQVVRSVREVAEVWIATSRPWQRLDNIDPDTVEWLRRNDITVDGIVYGEDKYAQLVSAIDPQRIVAVVDDLAEQCEKADDLGLFAIQRQTNWNRGARWRYGLDDLADIGSVVVEATTRWKEYHEHR